MSYGFAGMLQGLGGALQDLGTERRKHAQDLLKMEKKAEIDLQVAQGKANIKKASRSGKGRSRRSGRGLTNQESDNLGRIYDSYIENGSFGDEAPSLGEFEQRIELHIGEAGSLAKAAEQARSEWGSKDVTETTLHERHALSPARLWDEDGKYEVTSTSKQHGFEAVLSDASASEKASGNVGRPSDTKAEQIFQQAREAIANGAPSEEVKKRVREMGYDPGGI